MKRKRLLGMLMASVLTLSIFAGCGNKTTNEGSADNNASQTQTSDSEQVLNLIMLDPLTWDVNACYDSNSTTVLGAVYEGLVRISNDGTKDTIEPAGAESWETSEDGLVWTFKLRDNKWSDGEDVVAQHYVDSVIRLLNAESAFPYAFFGFDIKNGEAFYNGEATADEVGIKALDEKTLEITLENPVPYFLSKLSYTVFKPVRLDVIEAAGDAYATDYTKGVFNGPFVIEGYESGNYIKFAKNENYWDSENVKLETVNMTEIKEFATQAQLFEAKQLDVSGATNEYVEKWMKAAEEGQFQANISEAPSVFYIEFNQVNGGSTGLMSNQKVRQAIAYSLDREELTSELYGRYTPAYGFVPGVINIGDDLYRDVVEEPMKAPSEKYNTPEALQALLHEGLKELGKDTDDLSTIEITYLTYGDSELEKQRQEWWKQQIENNLGIKVNVQVEGDYALFTAAKNQNKHDILMSGWTADYNDPMTFLDMWVTGGSNNSVGYSSEEYDTLINSLKTENDEEKRKETYAKAEEVLLSDMAIAPLFYRDNRSFKHNYVKDFQMPVFGPSYEFRWAHIEGK
ncbi:peptide ABC transporter substrate-binding protein [Clostridium celatum]|uniref:ABC transporter, substrate-binding protein, family 5 n=1 Tax=Clostridium celatum DSM 1785 TaxID=545697 RepID=L1QKY1_9CLOT|nr:peptide ABC transporter substrate-binding protein [Clostridium celatum]EKY28601.1 ABC transporter, substrate-binding protein, family 5 [Clostridium celatum DSM 1785]MCE9654932.1 peptide ABC transporter substrate-binding protein [Clostridium celatum]